MAGPMGIRVPHEPRVKGRRPDPAALPPLPYYEITYHRGFKIRLGLDADFVQALPPAKSPRE